MTHQTSPKRHGRPTRVQASAKALASVDPAKVDPWVILAAIASDASAAAAARVSACKALIDNNRGAQEGAGSDSRINERAVAMMQRAN